MGFIHPGTERPERPNSTCRYIPFPPTGCKAVDASGESVRGEPARHRAPPQTMTASPAANLAARFVGLG